MDREKIPVWAIPITNGTKAIELITKAAAERIQSVERLFSFGGVEQDEEGAENLTASAEVKEQVLISGGEEMQTESDKTARTKGKGDKDMTNGIVPTEHDEEVMNEMIEYLKKRQGKIDPAFFAEPDKENFRATARKGYRKSIQIQVSEEKKIDFIVGFTKCKKSRKYFVLTDRYYIWQG